MHDFYQQDFKDTYLRLVESDEYHNAAIAFHLLSDLNEAYEEDAGRYVEVRDSLLKKWKEATEPQGMCAEKLDAVLAEMKRVVSTLNKRSRSGE